MLSAAPSGTDKNVTILENSAYTFAAADFGFSDPVDTLPNGFLAVKLTTRPELGVVTVNGAPAGVSQFIPLAEIAAGKLKFTPATSGNGLPYASFTFQVQDTGGTANGGADLDPTPNTFAIDVTPVNSAPSGRDNNYVWLFISGPSIVRHTFTLDEFGFSDRFDTPANNFLAVKIATLPVTGSLTNDGVLVTAGQLVSALDIAAGRLQFSAPVVPPLFGPLASFTFQVQDDGGTASGGIDLDPTPNTVHLVIECGECFPVSTTFTVTTPEDTWFTFSPNNFWVHSPTGVPQNLKQVRIETLPTQGVLLLDGFAVSPGMFIPASKIADGHLRYIPPANTNINNTQHPTFSYRAEDDNGLDPTPFTIGIRVESVNDWPISQNRTITAQEDTSYAFLPSDFPFFDFNDQPPNSLQAVRIMSLPLIGALTYNGLAVPAGEFVAASDIASGKLKFTFAANVHGSAYASFTFRVQDDGGTSNTGFDLGPMPNTLTIDVVAVNDPPSGGDKIVVTPEDAHFSFSAADFSFSDLSDSSPNGPPNSLLGVRITSLPARGRLELTGQPVEAGQIVSAAILSALRFVPAPNANGLAYTAFAFQVIDDGGTFNGGVDTDPTPNTITINVTPVNDKPIASADFYYQAGDIMNSFFMASPGLLSNDFDADGDPLTAILVNRPFSGDLTFNDDGSFLYQPTYGWYPGAPDTFTYRVSDGKDVSDVVTATITGFCWQWFCSSGPVFNETYTTPPNTAITISAPGVLRNDLYSPILQALLLSGPANGTVALGTDGIFTYTPNPGFVGTDSFTYAASNGLHTSGIATTSIVVTSNSRQPRGYDGAINLFEDTSYVFQPFDFVAVDSIGVIPAGFLGVSINHVPLIGSLTNRGLAVSAGQTVLLADISDGQFKYTPPANAFSSYFASYYDYEFINHFNLQIIDDGGPGGSPRLAPASNSLAINITPVNDPPSGVEGMITTQKDTPYVFSADDFRFTDVIDSSSDQLSAVRVSSLPTVGRLINKGVLVAGGDVVRRRDLTAGEFQYIPDPNQIGFPATSFTFQVQDDGGTLGGGVDWDATADKITINVSAGEYRPDGADKLLKIVQGTNLSVYHFSPADFGFRSPTGIPPAALTAVKITTLPPSSLGRLEKTVYNEAYYTTYVQEGELISAADIEAGVLKFVAFTSGAPLTNFTFQVQSIFGTDPTPNTITVSTCSDCRQPVFDTYTFNEDSSLVIAGPGVLANDRSGPIGLSPAVIAGPYHGTLVFNADGGFSYTPQPNRFGYDRFFYRATATDGDNKWVSSVAEARFYVTPINDPPSGADKTVTTPEDKQFNFASADFGFIDANDVPSHAMLGVKITSLPASGRLELNGVGVSAGQIVVMAQLPALRFVPALNANGTGHATFTFQVIDNGGTANGGLDADPTPNTITINVTSVNDPPIGSDSTRFVLEDTAHVLHPADFGFTDPFDVPANSLLAVKIATLPALGTLTNKSVAVTAGQTISLADLASGALQFTHPLNAGNTFTSLGFLVQDDGGTANGGLDLSLSSSTLTLQLLSGCSLGAPAIVRDTTVQIIEDREFIFIPRDFDPADGMEFPDDPFDAVKILTLPLAGSLTINGVTIAAGQFVSRSDIALGLVRYQPPLDAFGNALASFVFQVHNGGNLPNTCDNGTGTVTFNVTSVNDPPSFTPAVFSPLSDESGPLSLPGWATQVSVGPADESGQHGQYFVLENTNPGIFLAPPAIDANGILSFAPKPNAKGSAQITVVLKDDGGTADGGNDSSLPQMLTIEVFKARVMHNAQKPLDISGDNFVVAGDALDVINFLNAFRAQRVPDDGRAEGPYYDCDGDGFVTAADALEVINYLNAFGPDVEGLSGEGERAGIRSQASEVSGQATWDNGLEELTTLLAMDVAGESRKKKA